MNARPSALVAVLLAALAGPPPAAADPAEVRVGREPGRTRVVLDLDAPPRYRHFMLSAPDRAVFDIEGVVLAEPPPAAEFIGSPVAQLRAAPRGDGSLRIVLDLAREDLRIEHFTLRPYAGRGDRLVIDIYEPEVVAEAVANAAGGGTETGATPSEEPPPGTSAGEDVVAAAAMAPVPAAASAPTTAEASAAGPAAAAGSATQAADIGAALEPLPGLGGDEAFSLRPRGYAEFSAARTWPGEDRWSKLRARVEYGADGRFDNGARFRLVARAETDAAYFIEDDFYPKPVRDDQEAEVTLREAYLDLPLGDWELRLGRQHVVWGEMVGLFLADVVSAKDTREFYLQEFEAIRLPQWAVRAERFGANSHLELLWVPWPTYDNVGKPGANFYPFPGLDGPVPDVTPDRDDPENHGFGARYSLLVDGWDLSGFYYRSTDVAPTLYLPATGPELRHDRIHQLGATFSKDLRGYVLKGEAVYTAGRAFTSLDPLAELGVEHSDALDYIVGVTLPRDDWNFDFQLYGSHRFGHEEGMLYDAHEFGATVLAGYQFDERLEAQVLYLAGFNRSDRSFQGWLGWRFAPSWRLRVGVDWFDGEEIGFFGRYDDQDRVYLELKRWF
ncbi:AMIN domain-containing protein [Pseudohaliea sp.]|uniref:AMIN domain-containing protein n=1 Tax=Pseudohaliea sp. TaxID=2740289 RepID=UPI0032ED7709